MTLTLLTIVLATLIVAIPAYIDHKKQINRVRGILK